jgi:hypothetical protein
MPKTKSREEDNGLGQHMREAHSALLQERVMHVLGLPTELLKVQVKPLWGDYYRVNVLVGPDAASAKVAHSYFLMADADANIITCTPKITKVY